jgi:hypothetical protein
MSAVYFLLSFAWLSSFFERHGERINTTACSPGISDTSSMAHAAPVRAQVMLRLGQLPVAGQGGGHGTIESMSKLPSPSTPATATATVPAMLYENYWFYFTGCDWSRI